MSSRPKRVPDRVGKLSNPELQMVRRIARRMGGPGVVVTEITGRESANKELDKLIRRGKDDLASASKAERALMDRLGYVLQDEEEGPVARPKAKKPRPKPKKKVPTPVGSYPTETPNSKPRPMTVRDLMESLQDVIDNEPADAMRTVVLEIDADSEGCYEARKIVTLYRTNKPSPCHACHRDHPTEDQIVLMGEV